MGGHHLAQFNYARALQPLDHPVLADFVEVLEPVNALAEEAPGFVWRFQDETGNSTAYRVDDDERLIINLSVWEDLASLREFTYRGPHREVFGRRREWFEKATERQLVLWWIPVGHHPTPEEGLGRLEHLRSHGPTEEAFTFASLFEAPR